MLRYYNKYFITGNNMNTKRLTLAALLSALTLMSGCSGDNQQNLVTPKQEQVIVINGHTLPPEPDPKLNNATLIGIDSNNNGVRDDVERKIYLNTNSEVQRMIMMMSARKQQKKLEAADLVENAMKWEKLDKYEIGCMTYLFRTYGINAYRSPVEDYVYNTKERIKKYMAYNVALSGGVYGTDNKYKIESSCDFNVTRAIDIDDANDE